MIAGVGYDIFPMDWERVRNIANLEEGLLPLVGDVKVLYSASEEDLGRFRGLQVQMKDNLADKQKSQTAARKRAESACGNSETGWTYHYAIGRCRGDLQQ